MNRNLLIGLGILVVVLLGGVGMYNGLVQKDVSVTTAWSQVENVLQRRADLIPNLVSSTKGYMQHEKAIFEDLAKARSQYAGAKSQGEKVAAGQQMEGALARLLLIVENYPNLKANESFNKLMDELSGSENRIAVERKRYNEAVQDFNTTIRTLPNNLIAGTFGFKPKEFFQATEAAKEVPKVDFGTK